MITYIFVLNEAIVNVPTYLLSSSAFLSIKLADFIAPDANLITLLTLFRFSHPFCKVSFSAKILDWCRYFINKIGIILYARVIKINTRLASVYYTNGNEMDQMLRNDIACNCIQIDGIAFRYAHI